MGSMAVREQVEAGAKAGAEVSVGGRGRGSEKGG